jgi:hypothetical protein
MQGARAPASSSGLLPAPSSTEGRRSPRPSASTPSREEPDRPCVRGTRPLARGPLTPPGLDPGRDILDCLDAARRSSPASADAPQPRSDPRTSATLPIAPGGPRRGPPARFELDSRPRDPRRPASSAVPFACAPRCAAGLTPMGRRSEYRHRGDSLLRPRRDACAWRSSILDARCARRAPPAAGGRVTSSRLSSQPASRRRGHSRQPQCIGMQSQCIGCSAPANDRSAPAAVRRDAIAVHRPQCVGMRSQCIDRNGMRTQCHCDRAIALDAVASEGLDHYSNVIEGSV